MSLLRRGCSGHKGIAGNVRLLLSMPMRAKNLKVFHQSGCAAVQSEIVYISRTIHTSSLFISHHIPSHPQHLSPLQQHGHRQGLPPPPPPPPPPPSHRHRHPPTH